MSHNIHPDDFDFDSVKRKFVFKKKFKMDERMCMLNDKPLYDKVIDEAGVTAYNLKVFGIIAFLLLGDGGEMVVLALLTTKLAEEWNLSLTQKGILGSSVFIGFYSGLYFLEK